jgi:Domain of unknown function (DUF4348)
MKNLGIITLTFFVFISCADRVKKNEKAIPQKAESQIHQKTESQIENFEVFFDKFGSDSIFQSSRIKFPLPVETYDIDSEKFDKSTITADKWEFFNIKKLDKKYTFKTIKEKDQNIVRAQMEDTGVSVDYIFQKQQENRWMLVKIIDDST